MRMLLAIVLMKRNGSCSTIEDCRSEEHTSELQSQSNLVCRLLLEKKNNTVAFLFFGIRPHFAMIPSILIQSSSLVSSDSSIYSNSGTSLETYMSAQKLAGDAFFY